MSLITTETALNPRPRLDADKRNRRFHRHESGTRVHVQSDAAQRMNAYINTRENRRPC